MVSYKWSVHLLVLCLVFSFTNLTIISKDKDNFPCKVGELVKMGSGPGSTVEAEKIGKDSKFVFISIPPDPDLSYSAAFRECEAWGLTLAEINSPEELVVIQEYFENRGAPFSNESVTFWISGSDEGHEGKWVHSSSSPWMFQAFYGFSPRNLATSKNVTKGANNVMLHWTHDPRTKRKILVMMDVEGEDNFYEDKSFMCQYPKSSKCNWKSVEGMVYRDVMEAHDQFDVHVKFDLNEKLVLHLSLVQRTNSEAQKHCSSQSMEILNLGLSRNDSMLLWDKLQDLLDARNLSSVTTAFWVGSSTSFLDVLAKDTMKWDWIENSILNPKTDKVLKYNGKVREGKMQNKGKCLVFGVLNKKKGKFHVTHSPCDVPQWTLCSRLTRKEEKIITTTPLYPESDLKEKVITTTPQYSQLDKMLQNDKVGENHFDIKVLPDLEDNLVKEEIESQADHEHQPDEKATIDDYQGISALEDEMPDVNNDKKRRDSSDARKSPPILANIKSRRFKGGSVAPPPSKGCTEAECLDKKCGGPASKGGWFWVKKGDCTAFARCTASADSHGNETWFWRSFNCPKGQQFEAVAGTCILPPPSCDINKDTCLMPEKCWNDISVNANENNINTSTQARSKGRQMLDVKKAINSSLEIPSTVLSHIKARRFKGGSVAPKPTQGCTESECLGKKCKGPADRGGLFWVKKGECNVYARCAISSDSHGNETWFWQPSNCSKDQQFEAVAGTCIRPPPSCDINKDTCLMPEKCWNDISVDVNENNSNTSTQARPKGRQMGSSNKKSMTADLESLADIKAKNFRQPSASPTQGCSQSECYNNKCLGPTGDGGSFWDNNSTCTAYALCAKKPLPNTNGTYWIWRSTECPEGRQFEAVADTCITPPQGCEINTSNCLMPQKCWDDIKPESPALLRGRAMDMAKTVDPLCEKMEPNKWIHDENCDCKKAYKCNDKGQITERIDCEKEGNNTFFHPDINKCTSYPPLDCKGITCLDKKKGKMLPYNDPLCQKFYTCQKDNMAVVGTCNVDKDEWFDPEKNKCTNTDKPGKCKADNKVEPRGRSFGTDRGKQEGKHVTFQTSPEPEAPSGSGVQKGRALSRGPSTHAVTSTPDNEAFDCDLHPTGIKFLYPSQGCSKYFECLEGKDNDTKEVHVHCCPEGSYFDEKDKMCVKGKPPYSDDICNPVDEISCKKYPHNTLLPYPSPGCTKYFKCTEVGNKMHLFIICCGSNMYFDPSSQECRKGIAPFQIDMCHPNVTLKGADRRRS